MLKLVYKKVLEYVAKHSWFLVLMEGAFIYDNSVPALDHGTNALNL